MAALLKSVSVFLAFIIQITGIFSLPFIPGEEFDKPIDTDDGGDPFIVEDNGNTYYTFTTGGGIDIRKIVSYNDTTVIEQKTVYWAGNDGIDGQIWAPEIHKIGNRWYITACALFRKDCVEKGRMPEAKSFEEHDDYYRYGFVLESKTEDVFGEYEFKGILAPDGLNNIDGTYLKKDGKLYYICSAYVDIAHQCIYICEMENPYTLIGNAVMISRPEYKWEKNGWYVNEGPAVLYKGDKIYIVYSASGYSSGEYCMGMLTLKNNDVMNPKSWLKNINKVYAKKPYDSIYHTGHCSFLYRDNGETFMVYHATDNKDFTKSRRCTYIRKLEFFGDYPVFM